MGSITGAFAVLIARILVFGIIAPTLPAMRMAFHATYFQAGLGMSLAFAGTMIANLIGGPSVDRWGEKKLLNLGNLLGIAGPFFVAYSKSLLDFYIGMVLIGLSSVSFVAALALISESGRHSRITMLNAAHGTMAVFLALDPWIAGYLLDLGLKFQQLFAFGAWFSVFIAIFFLFCRIKRHNRPKGPGVLIVYKALLLNKYFLIILLGVFLYIGLETGVTTWIPIFLVNYDHFSQGTAGLGLMLFWFLMAGGRFFIPRFRHNLTMGQTVRLLLIGAAGLIGFVLIGVSPLLDLLFLGVTGLFMSVSFPLFQAVTAQQFPDQVGSAFGLLSATVGFAGMIFPSIMGWVSDLFHNGSGLKWALLIPFVMALSASFFAVFMLKSLKQGKIN